MREKNAEELFSRFVLDKRKMRTARSTYVHREGDIKWLLCGPGS